MNQIAVLPMDDHNQTLVSNVHPPDWVNPEPASRYNLVVMGAGTAGLVTAAAAASLGARVALIERHLLGGDCLNVGCVPSKCVIRASRTASELHQVSQYGVDLAGGTFQIDFAVVMERMRRLRARISHHDSAQRFRDLGVDVFLGQGQFVGRDAAKVEDKILRFKKTVIATGGRPTQPSIPGLADAGFLTNETIFSLTERPAHLAVLGGGPIGCELSQAFRRLGSQVTIIQKDPQFLPREDREVAEILAQTFRREGIDVRLGTKLTKVDPAGDRKKLHLESNGKQDSLEVDQILVAVGRTPNVDSLNLEAAGVEYTAKGVQVNDFLQTSNPRIYAAGDVCMAWQFTHAAAAAAQIVIQNSLFLGRKRLSALTMPWCTYTDPEIAHVGLYEKDAQERGIEVKTFVRPFSEVDRGIIDGEEGFVKMMVKKGSDKILGATIVNSHAGEMISEIGLAMVAGVGLKTLSNVIHPYPTQAEAIKHIGDAYNRTRLTPVLKTLFSTWFSWTR